MEQKKNSSRGSSSMTIEITRPEVEDHQSASPQRRFPGRAGGHPSGFLTLSDPSRLSGSLSEPQ